MVDKTYLQVKVGPPVLGTQAGPAIMSSDSYFEAEKFHFIPKLVWRS